MTTLVSIETTPNPNSMKLNLSEALELLGTFSAENMDQCPVLIQQLLLIPGVAGIFATTNFLTLNRDPRLDWQPILEAVRNIFAGESPESEVIQQRVSAEQQGQVQVWVQTFRKIPLQIKVTDGVTEERAGLSERFGATARELQGHFAADYLKERFWADWGTRYGALNEVAHEVAEEIESLWSDTRLRREKELALGYTTAKNKNQAHTDAKEATSQRLSSPDWQERFQAVQEMEATEETLSLLVQALQDEKPQIRRWIAAKLAGVKTAESVKALSEALLNDPNVGVRRTAGDSLSDIGDISAQGAICKALEDPNKLVRWRAARFLAEVGNEEALPSLEKTKQDPEYEVRLEVEAAIHHIEEGSKAAMPVWKLMAQGKPEVQ
ncbi:virulence factor [Vampirovibrio sp.]|uniref:virulence factor n=1 Tax=Vampirovibrio sp. TaxID=2717857 RepID=UPI00359390BD